MKYEDLPHFPKSTAPGHKSRMISGTLNGVPVLLMQGRFHLYEGYSIHKVSKSKYVDIGRIHLPHLWIRKYFMDDSSINFHDKVFLHFFQKFGKK